MTDDANTLIIANSARLLADAKLLADHGRFASAFALALLGVEEIGKVILDLWGNAEPLSKPIVRRKAHVRKQAAVGSLLLASFAVQEFGDLDAEVTVTDEVIERVNAALQSSSEGQFLAHAESGVLEKTKHVGLYRDNVNKRRSACRSIQRVGRCLDFPNCTASDPVCNGSAHHACRPSYL